ncbi:DUF4199 domain-containing protein [Mangrovimonas sp. YM274]|uniref:DUF4199 domain-containing protein n=1 Tax=Mangrovimonas sp. YM274 TaxID=3070660 RepID=UPI0027DCE40F|nr:DUF4199 domain-containing protein [Mangrovimonas sp. YM274]WMI69935.1 DUF4199 domain-containing protein [Mangrovimonas sp. YM274]
MEKSIKSSALNYGLYLGATLVLVTVLSYAINLELLTKWWLGIILFLVILVFGIVSTARSKGLLKGFISFKEAFSSYFITIAVGFIISTLVSIVLFNVIDPEASEILKENVMESSRQMMENFGAPQSEIDKAMVQMEGENQFAMGNQLKSVAFQLVFYSIIGLIVALAMKRNDPNAA